MASTPPARATARRPLLRTVATVAESATLTIRPARAEDLAAGVDAYNAGIAERLATFETEPRTIQDIAGWIDDGQPFIVAEHAGRVLGWARAGTYSERCVYQRRTLIRTHRALSDGGYGCGHLSRDNGNHTGGTEGNAAPQKEKSPASGAFPVRPRGLEPPRTIKSTRPSTLRVYQFRHRRVGRPV